MASLHRHSPQGSHPDDSTSSASAAAAGPAATGQGRAESRPESIDPELAFEAAVALALSCGAIAHAGEAVREASHFSASGYVLMGPGAMTLKRFAQAEIVAELERQARIHDNLEHYQLRFRPRHTTVLAALLAGCTALVSMQAWMNQISERRLTELEQSFLDHQAFLTSATSGSTASGPALAAIETVAEFEDRLQRSRFEGCYQAVKANLAKATDQLVLADQSPAAAAAPRHLQDARAAYGAFQLARRSCSRSVISPLAGWWPR